MALSGAGLWPKPSVFLGFVFQDVPVDGRESCTTSSPPRRCKITSQKEPETLRIAHLDEAGVPVSSGGFQVISTKPYPIP